MTPSPEQARRVRFRTTVRRGAALYRRNPDLVVRLPLLGMDRGDHLHIKQKYLIEPRYRADPDVTDMVIDKLKMRLRRERNRKRDAPLVYREALHMTILQLLGGEMRRRGCELGNMETAE